MLIPDFKLRAPDGAEHPITGPFRIGRDPQCQIRIDNNLASRIHASIWLDNGQLQVRDERSHNGTLVNGRRLPPGAVHRLFAGDRLQIAGATYTVESPPVPEPPATMPPSPSFAAQRPRQRAAPPVPAPWLAVAGGCAVLIVMLLCCVAGGFLLAGPVRPIIATALAPRGAQPPDSHAARVRSLPATPAPAQPPGRGASEIFGRRGGSTLADGRSSSSGRDPRQTSHRANRYDDRLQTARG